MYVLRSVAEVDPVGSVTYHCPDPHPVPADPDPTFLTQEIAHFFANLHFQLVHLVEIDTIT
jgi:hypothetical protein